MTERTESQYVTLTQKVGYGFGAFANNMLAAASGGMMGFLVLGYGLSPVLVALISSIPRLSDALTDPIMGYLSDHTKSRWGRRRPYIFSGAIAAGLIFMLLWQLPTGLSTYVYTACFLSGLVLFFLAYTVFATPWVALGYELTPNYHERTVLMAIQNLLGQLAYLIAPWFLWFVSLDSFDNIAEGSSWLAILVGLGCMLTGIVPAIFLRERFAGSDDTGVAGDSDGSPSPTNVGDVIGDFARGFVVTVVNKDFLRLCGATFLVFNGFQMIAGFQIFVVIYFVYAGDAAAAGELMGTFGTLTAISTFAVIAITTELSRRFGKRRTFFVCIGISTFGYALKWFCYNPEAPQLLLLCAFPIAFGLGSLFTLMPSMIAEICDEDEMNTSMRREGMFGSIYWWVVKLGMSLALLASGFLLEATGFDVNIEQTAETLFWMRFFDVVIPVVASLLAIYLVVKYSITEERALGIRKILEERRGVI